MTDTGGAAEVPEDWARLLADLANRESTARSMGGGERLQRLQDNGGRSARAWVDSLVDPDSFREIGLLAGSWGESSHPLPADGYVAGSARIDGRRVFVGVEDPTVAGGSVGVAGGSKRVRVALLAARHRVPLVLLLSGAGHRVTNALAAHRPTPNDLQVLADVREQVPVLTVVTGPAAGHSALVAPMSDCVIMVRGRGALFAAGPPLVTAATGERTTVEDLGGVAVHAQASGLVDLVAEDPDDAVLLVRRVLDFAGEPGNRDAINPVAEAGPGDVAPRDLPEVLHLIPADARRPYDMRSVVEAVADAGSTLDLGATHGGSLLTVLARVGGHRVAILASQPLVLAGSIDAHAAAKAARFVERTGRWGLPLVILADTPGFLVGVDAEREGTLRAGADLFVAQRRSPVAKIHVTIRKAYGFGSSVLGANPFDHQVRTMAFPGAVLGGMPAAVGASATRATEAERQELVGAEASGPWRLASALGYDEVIDPRQLRNSLIDALALGALPTPPTPMSW